MNMNLELNPRFVLVKKVEKRESGSDYSDLFYNPQHETLKVKVEKVGAAPKNMKLEEGDLLHLGQFGHQVIVIGEGEFILITDPDTAILYKETHA
tara:strand:- start:2063 stop:2347 length:285 start_codon:yes stop_codon:yes gene_type:complete